MHTFLSPHAKNRKFYPKFPIFYSVFCLDKAVQRFFNGRGQNLEKTLKFLAAAAGAAAGFYSDMPIAVKLLMILMVLDYLSAISAAVLRRSPKSECGALCSKTGFKGILRKGMMLAIILLAAVLDRLIDSAACTGAVTLFYIVNESLSILENAVLLDVPIPKRLLQVLDVAQKSHPNSGGP